MSEIMLATNRYKLTHSQSGQYLATISAPDPDSAIRKLLSERGYTYYEPRVVRTELLAPVQRTDSLGNPLMTVTQ